MHISGGRVVLVLDLRQVYSEPLIPVDNRLCPFFQPFNPLKTNIDHLNSVLRLSVVLVGSVTLTLQTLDLLL